MCSLWATSWIFVFPYVFYHFCNQFYNVLPSLIHVFAANRRHSDIFSIRRHVLSSIHVTECHFAVAVTMSHQQLKSNVGDISLFSLCFVWFFLENTHV